MLRLRHLVLFLSFMVVSPVLSLGADSPAIGVLKEKGLTRSGRYFVLEDAENAVVEKWQESRPILVNYAANAKRKNEAELSARELAQLEERRVELQEGLNMLNQQINEQGFQQSNIRPAGGGQGAYVSQLIARRNMVQMNLSQIVETQKAFKTEVGDKKSLDAQSKKSLDGAAAVLKDLRESVNAVTKQYDKLGADADVKAALRTLEHDKVGAFKLGPSTAFKSAVKSLENAERTILAKRTSTGSRKKVKSKR